jgi:hypothetical protein
MENEKKLKTNFAKQKEIILSHQKQQALRFFFATGGSSVN